MSRNEILEELLTSSSLPTLSTVASRLIAATSRCETTVNDITQLIACDVSLSAKLLRVVNSAFYSFPSEITTIQQAVTILGTNAVRSLVLSFSFLSGKRVRNDGGFDYEHYWEKSLSSAVSAKMITAQIRSDIDPEEAFTVGLLQKVGVLVLAQAMPEKYDAVLRAFAAGSEDIIELEAAHLGVTHPEVGAAVARHWQFPSSLAVPIAFHRQPDAYDGSDPKLRKMVQIAYLSGLVSNIIYSKKPIDYAERFRHEARRRLGLQSGAIDHILESVSLEVAATADYFEVKIATPPSVPEILQRANVELSLLNMSYEQMNRELVSAKVELERLNAELKQKNRYLESIANLDGLTGVYNHRFFQETLERELKRSVRKERPMSLVLADLDRFKAINDTHGHRTGDFILREVCRLWQKQLREYDLLARYGGEEFVILLPETRTEEGCLVAEKLREATEQYEFRNGPEIYAVTCSFGISTFEPGQNVQAGDLIEQADAALYDAKRRGRNRVEIYTPKKKGWLERLTDAG